MNFILYGLVSVCLVGIANAASMPQRETCEELEFECDPADPKAVIVNGFRVQCQAEQICNTMNKCSTCMDVSTTCYDQFSCPPDITTVTIQNNTYKCPTNYQCNKNFTEPCDPCVMTPCPEDSKVTCDASDPTKGSGDAMSFQCNEGTVCNKDNLQPCKPCIAAEVGTTSLPIITTRRPEITSSATIQPPEIATSAPVEPPTETTLVPTPQPETISTSTSSLEEEAPDCNDGYGTTRACRPSKIIVENEQFYYRCVQQFWWYNVELLSCSRRDQDDVCKMAKNICS